MNDERLRAAYRKLMERRAAQPPPDIDLDVMQGLAEGTAPPEQRDALMDRVLSHPETALEFSFLSEIAQTKRGRVHRVVPWLAAATVAGVLLTGALVVQRVRQSAPDVLRGDADTPVLLKPEIGADITAGTQFFWNTFANAISYEIQLIDADGNVVAETSTRDTTWALPTDTAIEPDAELFWWITARLPDGTERRAAARKISGG
jgi:hypothetical protein